MNMHHARFKVRICLSTLWKCFHRFVWFTALRSSVGSPSLDFTRRLRASWKWAPRLADVSEKQTVHTATWLRKTGDIISLSVSHTGAPSRDERCVVFQCKLSLAAWSERGMYRKGPKKKCLQGFNVKWLWYGKWLDTYSECVDSLVLKQQHPIQEL